MTSAIGLDLGTTSISAAAVSSEGTVAAVSIANDAAIGGLPAGRAEQDPIRLQELACRALRELAAKLPSVPACLGLTGQMHGGLLVDGGGRPVSNLVTWQDKRSLEAGRGGGTPLDEFRERIPPESLDALGCRPSPGYLAVTLFTLAKSGGLPSGARGVCLADWIGAELGGHALATDPTHAASTGAFDARANEWSGELLGAVGLPRGVFPDVRESGEPLGRLTDEAARATGLPEGLPVCNSVGDNQAAFLGSVPAGDAAVQINVGTGGQVNWPVEKFVRCSGMETRPLPPGRFLLVGAGLVGGDGYAWVGRTIERWLAAFDRAADPAEIFARLGELAQAAPDDCGGLRCAPLFRGTRQSPDARGSFTGIDGENFTPGNVARAALAGIAEGFRSFHEQAGNLRPARFERSIASGNGMRKNPLLATLVARAFGKSVWLPEHEEEAAVGAALLAGSRTGVWSDLVEAGKRIRLRRIAE